jgi:hypothetical protein
MTRGWIVQSASLGIVMASAACAAADRSTFDEPGDGGAEAPSGDDASPPGFGVDGGGTGSPGVVQPTGPVTDFPAPVIDGNAPASSPTLFGPQGQGATSGGPCLVEPESDVVYPQNWLRPRFTWRAAQGENLFELRLHVANQIEDLVVYTTSTSWTMPVSTWNALRAHSPTEAMTLSVRGGVLAGGALQGEALGTSTPMGVAPVQATGAIVYWWTDGTATGASGLKGFSPGDETVQSVLSPAQYSQAQGTTSTCIGCHTSTPDGEFVAFTTTTTNQAEWVDALALIDPDAGALGTAPSYASSAGAQALARWNVGAAAFSPAHWKTGDRRAVVSFDNDDSASNIVLSWFDLEATSPALASGTLARTGDTQLAAAPAWSHDGNTVAYVSTNRTCTGRLGNCTPQYQAPADTGSRADLYVVPYAGGAGGNATPVQGASDPSLQEYYPSFSPDDRWLVFNRISNDANLYDQPAAEVFVVAESGGTPKRLAANDPPACSGVKSPGITNSWGKWGPTAYQANGSTYYWLVFSSKRSGAGVAQLYITSLVQAADGTLTTHGAIYLWNQPSTESNHTPAWDTFKVPVVNQ